MNEKNIEKRAEELGFQKMKFMKTKDLPAYTGLS